MINELAREAGKLTYVYGPGKLESPSTEQLQAEIDASDQGTLRMPYIYVM